MKKVKFDTNKLYKSLPPWEFYEVSNKELLELRDACEATRDSLSDSVAALHNNMKTIHMEILKRFKKWKDNGPTAKGEV